MAIEKEDERAEMEAKIGKDIYIKVTITNIKRDPKITMQAPFQDKLVYFEKIREIGKELIVEGEFSNARTLYARCVSYFKNMPKLQKEGLNEEDRKKKDDILSILFLNCAHCLIKKKMYKEAIKAC